jgi:hypothetical protein
MRRIQRRLNSASSSASGSALPLSGMSTRAAAGAAGKCSASASSVYVVIAEFTTYLL